MKKKESECKFKVLFECEVKCKKKKEEEEEEVLRLVGPCDICNLLSPCTVCGISESWVVRVKLLAIRQHLLSKLIQVRQLAREPGHWRKKE